MMQFPPLLQYLLETSLCLGFFYLMYVVLFRKNTFFQTNRFYLITGAITSFLIPIFQFSLQEEEVTFVLPIMIQSEVIAQGFNKSIEKTGFAAWSIADILLFIYGIGIIVFSLQLFRRLWKIYSLKIKTSRTEMQGIKVSITEKQDTSSFFKWLFIHPRHQHEGENLILEHEKVHIRQRHSLDVLFMEILTIINWFNPIIHLYNRSLRETHEFIADELVSAQAASKYDYAKLLVQEVGKSINPSLSNTFASLIKKRLIMLSTKKSSKQKGWYYLLVLPLLGLLLSLFSFNLADPISGFDELRIPESVEEISLFSKEETPTNLIPDLKPTAVVALHADTLPQSPSSIPTPHENDIFKKVDKMPCWASCADITDAEERKKCNDREIINFIVKNIRYPEEARKQNIEGTAIIRFIIEKDGSIHFPDNNKRFGILRNPGVGTGEEAMRVVKTMPKWSPGQNEGLSVRTEYVLPIIFKLDKKTNEIPTPPPSHKNDIFKKVEKMPCWASCADIKDAEERKKCNNGEIINFIVKNIRYPEEARKQNIEGTAIIRFIIEKDGSLSFNDDMNNVILRNPGGGTGKEALRVVQAMPKWSPGIENGKAVRVLFTLPIRFALENKDKTEQNNNK